MQKYGKENTGATVARMRKLHADLQEDKERKIFFDFSNLENKIPADIMQEVQESIMRSATFLSDYEFGHGAISRTTGKYHSVDCDLNRYTVWNANGKRVYRIVEIDSVRVLTYPVNVYGVVPSTATPERVEVFGNLRTGTAAIEHIEF